MQDTLELLRQVESTPGWTVKRRSGGHVQATGPDGAIVHMSATPSDHRAHANNKATLARAGFNPGAEDTRRAERMARARRESDAASNVDSVLDALRDAHRSLRAAELALLCGLNERQVHSSLQYLMKRCPGKVRRVATGLYRWVDDEHAAALVQAPAPKPAPKPAPAPPVTEPASPDRELAELLAGMPTLVQRKVSKDDAPSLLEAITPLDGNLVCMDENGGLWLSMRLVVKGRSN